MSLEKNKIQRLETALVDLEKIIEDKSRELYLKNESLEKMALFAQHNPFPVLRIDMNYKVLKSNPAAKIIEDLSLKRALSSKLNNLEQLISSNSSIRTQVEHDQKTFLVQVEGISHYNCAHLYFFDISKQVKSQKQLEIERPRSLEASKMATLGELSGGLSHEINTPLNTISLCQEQLKKLHSKEKIDKELAIEILEDIQSASSMIDKIVRSFKFYARADQQGKFVYSDLLEVVENAISILSYRFKNKSIDIRFENKTGEESCLIECNPTQLCQVFVNLLKNSLDEIKESSTPWIKVVVEQTKTGYELRFIDSGSGIAEDYIDKIFNPFFTSKDIGEGTGLGLSVSKGIIDSHKGKLSLNQSHPNTCFEVKLPKTQ